MEYKRNTTIAKREMRRRQRASWEKFVTHLEHETYINNLFSVQI
jgi:hypothetical protein